MTSLDDCRALDAQDPLRELRHQFDLPPGIIYLDGNSLGVLPRTAAARVAQAVTGEWGQGLIRSWNSAGWFDLPQRLGDKIARLVGARPGEVVATDSTSINLYKVLSAALSLARQDAPGRNIVVSERSNFPTDLYITQSLAAQHGCVLELVDDFDAAMAELHQVACRHAGAAGVVHRDGGDRLQSFAEHDGRRVQLGELLRAVLRAEHVDEDDAVDALLEAGFALVERGSRG